MSVFKGLTPELTGAGGPTGPKGTNIGHQNREAMANVGVRVERFVRLGRVGRVWQVHSKRIRFEYSQISGNSASHDKLTRQVERAKNQIAVSPMRI